MKTGEEKFDDEIRQKLRYSEVKPPADLFDNIVPPKDNKKRGFFWIWLTGIVILGITTVAVQFFTGNRNGIPQKKYTPEQRNKSGNVNNSGTMNDGHAAKNESFSHENTPATTTNQLTTEHRNEQEHSNTSSNTGSHQSRPEANRSNVHNDPADQLSQSNSETIGLYASIRQKNESGNIYNYDLLNVPAPSLPYESHYEISQQLRIIKPDKRPLYMHRPTPFSIEISAAISGFNQNIKSSTDDTLALRLFETGKASMNSPAGWGMNARVLYALSEKLSIGAGIGYSKREESMRMVFTDYTKEMSIDSIIYYILFPFHPPEQVIEIDSTIFYSEHQHDINHKLTFKSFTFNAGVGYSIPIGAFYVEPGVNVSVDLFTQVDGNSNFNSTYTETKGSNYYNHSVQYGIAGNVLLGYSVSEKITVFINPSYRYDFTSMKTTPSFYDVKYNRMSLGCGIRYSIFKKQEIKRNVSGPDIVKR